MIVRTKAIPLAYYPYSSTSRIVHWLTQQYGKVSTQLKGALRPKSPFLGEYDLFNTSELLYFTKQAESLHTAKECSLLHARHGFRTDWRATQTASYLTALFNKTTPSEAPHPGHFELFEELLDSAEQHGNRIQFLYWAELRICDYHGHSPQLGSCLICSSGKDLRFSAAAGGTVCPACCRSKKLPYIECPAEALDLLARWKQTEHPDESITGNLSEKNALILDTVLGTFMRYHFNIQPELRNLAAQGHQA